MTDANKTNVPIVARKRLLFVDDERGIRETLGPVLRKHGFEVTLAETVGEALAEIRSREFDLLVCDLNIAHENDGFEVIRAMRRINPNCINVILTGYPNFESAVEGIHTRVDDYIVKPTEAEAFLETLAAQLRAREHKARVLSVSYHDTLLRMRRMILESAGYAVVSALGLEAALQQCSQGGFDAFVLGHSIPDEHKRKMVDSFRLNCPAPVISLRRGSSEKKVDGADFHIEPDPEPLLDLLHQITSAKSDDSADSTL